MLGSIIRENILISIILLTAVALRFYDFWNLPFTHDELSAIFRTRFSGFSELITNGVLPDGHPAGIQAFMYWIVNVFGENEIAIKLPFLLFGTLSIYVLWRIAQMWFNQTVALISASFLAVMQYFVMYSQIARPYISGVFFVLLTAFFITKIALSDKVKRTTYIYFVISATLCAYNHYFSSLTAFIIGGSGLLLIPKKRLLPFIGASVATLLLFLPHIKITLHQLTHNKLSWLSSPNGDFFYNFTKYSFHFSYWFGGVAAALAALGVFFALKRKKLALKRILILAVWFFLVFFTGYYYSVTYNPILQISTLIFVFPFLIMAGFFPRMSNYFNTLAVFAVLISGTVTLANSRNHYEIFYESPYEESIKESSNIAKQVEAKNVTLIIDMPKNIFNFYANGLTNFDTTKIFQFSDYSTPLEFEKMLSEIETEYCIFIRAGGCDASAIWQIKNKFPINYSHKFYFTGEMYFFSKTTYPQNPNSLFAKKYSYGFDKNEIKFGNYEKNKLHKDSISNYGNIALIDSSVQYSPAIEIDLDTISITPNDIIHISAKILLFDSSDKLLLASQIKFDDDTEFWRAINSENFITSSGKWQNINLAIPLASLSLDKNNILKIFVWNKYKSKFVINNITIETQRGNTKLYGLFEPIITKFNN